MKMNLNVCKNCSQGEMRIIMDKNNHPKTLACTPYLVFGNAFLCDLTKDLYDYVLENTSVNSTRQTPFICIKFLKFDKEIKKSHPKLAKIHVNSQCCPYYLEHQINDWNDK